jgi:4-hydroxy-3-polyprenylbenzoate decarboxylase
MDKLIVGIGGSSGSIYARLLLDRLAGLSSQYNEIAIVVSRNAAINWSLEIKDRSIESYGHKVYAPDDFMSPVASGSSRFMTMIVCPCSMGALARIAHGLSDDLMTRAADVILKERRKLILVPRETPFSLIHLDNMRKLAKAGAVICPAIPSFYNQPESIEKACLTVVDRVLDLAGFNIETFRWGSSA